MSIKKSEMDYVITYRWMRDILELKGNELTIYAIIYGYSHDGEGEFYGGLQYLQDWTGATKKTVIVCLESLVEKNLVKKEECITRKIKTCRYSVSMDKVPVAIDRSSLDRYTENDTSGVIFTPVDHTENDTSGVIFTPNIKYRTNINLDNSSISTLDTCNDKETRDNDSIYEDVKAEEKKNVSNEEVQTKKRKRTVKEVHEPNCEEYRSIVLSKKYEERLEKRLLDWLDYKTERGDKYTPTGLKTLLKQIENNCEKYSVGKMCKCIDTCIGRNYQGIIFDLMDKMQSTRPNYKQLD